MMRTLDRMLGALLPGEAAGACHAPECEDTYEWINGWTCRRLCRYRCDGSLYCSGCRRG